MMRQMVYIVMELGSPGKLYAVFDSESGAREYRNKYAEKALIFHRQLYGNLYDYEN